MGSCLRVRRATSSTFRHLSIVLPAGPPLHPRFTIKGVHPDPSQPNLKPSLSLLNTKSSKVSLCLKRPRESENHEFDAYTSTSGSTSSSASVEVGSDGCSRPNKQHKYEHVGDSDSMTSWAKHLFGNNKKQTTDATRTRSGETSASHPLFGTFGLNLDSKSAPLMYVFDFDQTILEIHSYGSRIRAEDVSSRSLEADVADREFFRAFIDTIRAAGVLVAVASFGEYEVIQNYLDRIAPGVFHRGNICTPSCVGYKDGCSVPEGKVPMLDLLVAELLCENDRKVSPELRARTVLFDDQENNTRRANQSGYLGCFTPEAFTRSAWPTIRADLPESVLTQ